MPSGVQAGENSQQTSDVRWQSICARLAFIDYVAAELAEANWRVSTKTLDCACVVQRGFLNNAHHGFHL